MHCREAILTGEFHDGEELNQVALAKRFGVSRVPLREALRQLQAEGLVTAKAHQSMVVTALDRDGVIEILELRALIEGHLMLRAVAKVTDDDIARLQELCDEMDRIRDHLQWLDTNRAFHQALYSAADAPLTVELVQQLAKRIERYLHLWSDEGIERTTEANGEHRAIVKAIEQRDARAACRELDGHIAHTRERVLELFESNAVRSNAEAV